MIEILDIGGRYGVHPSFEKIREVSNIHLFEPESKEFMRLKQKYSCDPRITVVNLGLGSKKMSGEMGTLVVTNHAGLSSVMQRDMNLSINIPPDALDVQDRQTIKLVSGDEYCVSRGIKPDYLKIDVEGMELEVLHGLEGSLSSVVGVRCEVSFDDIFCSGRPQFSDISDLMFRNDFKLLNLDYAGKGNAFSGMVDPCERYGILQSTDAVWIRNPFTFSRASYDDFTLAKGAIFAYLNNAADLFIKIINDTDMGLLKHEHPEMFRFLRKTAAEHFYNIRRVPGLRQTDIDEFHEHVFKEKLPKYSQFNESLEYNP